LQGSINWPLVAQSQIFAFVKATDGLSPDKTFLTNINGALDAGLYVAAYHVADPSHSNGSTQANYFLNNGGKYIVGDKKLVGALFMENRTGVEFCYGLSQKQMISWVYEFIFTCVELMYYMPIIYTRYGFTK